MARMITIQIEMTDDDITQGWADDLTELEGSIAATLHEVAGDDGGVYVPRVLDVEIDGRD